MKTLDQFMEARAPKVKVIGKFKKDPSTQVVLKKAKFAGMDRYTAFVQDEFGSRKIKTGIDLDLSDAEIAKELENGSWAKTFKAAGGVNWTK